MRKDNRKSLQLAMNGFAGLFKPKSCEEILTAQKYSCEIPCTKLLAVNVVMFPRPACENEISCQGIYNKYQKTVCNSLI